MWCPPDSRTRVLGSSGIIIFEENSFKFENEISLRNTSPAQQRFLRRPIRRHRSESRRGVVAYMAATAQALLVLRLLVFCAPARRVLAQAQDMPSLLPVALVRGDRTRSIDVCAGPDNRTTLDGRHIWRNYRSVFCIALPRAARDVVASSATETIANMLDGRQDSHSGWFLDMQNGEFVQFTFHGAYAIHSIQVVAPASFSSASRPMVRRLAVLLATRHDDSRNSRRGAVQVPGLGLRGLGFRRLGLRRIEPGPAPLRRYPFSSIPIQPAERIDAGMPLYCGSRTACPIAESPSCG
jgi:hypothetical protein